MGSKPYIKPIRQKMTNTWCWTWRCPRKDHPSHTWCGDVFDTWPDCLNALERHFREHHDQPN